MLEVLTQQQLFGLVVYVVCLSPDVTAGQSAADSAGDCSQTVVTGFKLCLKLNLFHISFHGVTFGDSSDHFS